jgi:hypothetical protein
MQIDHPLQSLDVGVGRRSNLLMATKPPVSRVGAKAMYDNDPADGQAQHRSSENTGKGEQSNCDMWHSTTFGINGGLWPAFPR